MSARSDSVADMTEHERIVFLSRLADRWPEVFDEIYADTGRQRELRALRERAAALEDGSDEGQADG